MGRADQDPGQELTEASESYPTVEKESEMIRKQIGVMLLLGAVVALVTGLGLAGPTAGNIPPAKGDECARAKADRPCNAAAGGECCCTPAARTSAFVPLTLTLLRAAGQDDKKTGEKKAGEAAVAKGDTARKALVEQRKALAKDGVWDCCIEPGCVFCQTAADGCPCEMNLKKGSAVCPECWGGWQAGHGQVKGIDPARVPLPSKETLKKLYDMKVEKLKKAEGGEK